MGISLIVFIVCVWLVISIYVQPKHSDNGDPFNPNDDAIAVLLLTILTLMFACLLLVRGIRLLCI